MKVTVVATWVSEHELELSDDELAQIKATSSLNSTAEIELNPNFFSDAIDPLLARCVSLDVKQ